MGHFSVSLSVIPLSCGPQDQGYSLFLPISLTLSFGEWSHLRDMAPDAFPSFTSIDFLLTQLFYLGAEFCSRCLGLVVSIKF